MILISNKQKDKYNVDKSEKGKLNRTYKGNMFDSEMEMKYVIEVIEPKIKSGEILNYKTQVKYELLPAFEHDGQKYLPIHYKSDFNIYYSDGTEEVVDIKGLAKPMDILKKKLLLYRYPDINFHWLVRSIQDGGWCDYDVVKKARAKRKKEKKNVQEKQ